jgi:siroheme synthase-like protein
MIKPRKSANPYYPLLIDLRKKKCVVVGGGRVALRKAVSLLECGAKVTVISREFVPEFEQIRVKKPLHLLKGPFIPKGLNGATIVIAATDSRETNQGIALEARKRGAIVNVVDDPDESDFIVPSYFRRGDLTLAVSTGGASPAFARKIRTWLEKSLGEDYSKLLSLVKEVRKELKQRKKAVPAEVWQEGLDLGLLIGLVRKGKEDKVKKVLRKRLIENEES